MNYWVSQLFQRDSGSRYWLSQKKQIQRYASLALMRSPSIQARRAPTKSLSLQQYKKTKISQARGCTHHKVSKRHHLEASYAWLLKHLQNLQYYIHVQTQSKRIEFPCNFLCIQKVACLQAQHQETKWLTFPLWCSSTASTMLQFGPPSSEQVFPYPRPVSPIATTGAIS